MKKLCDEVNRLVASGEISMSELAERSGVTRTHLYSVLRNGVIPRVDTAQSILKAVGMRLEIVRKRS